MVTKTWKFAALGAALALAATAADMPAARIEHKTRQVGDVKIFYREAGSPTRPTLEPRWPDSSASASRHTRRAVVMNGWRRRWPLSTAN